MDTAVTPAGYSDASGTAILAVSSLTGWKPVPRPKNFACPPTGPFAANYCN